MNGRGFVAVSLPVAAGRLAPLVISEAGSFARCEAALEQAALDAIMVGLASRTVELSVSHFTIETDTSLVSDFSAFSTEVLSIDGVVHEAILPVSEEGVTLQCATATGARSGGPSGANRQS